MLSNTFLTLVGIAAIFVPSTSSRACITALLDSIAVQHLRLTSENTVIVWDQEHEIEHFIRIADFHTNVREFGFIVPTPSIPELAEVTPDVFNRIQRIVSSNTSMGLGDLLSAQIARPDQIKVISRQIVAGLDATILDAGNGKALEKWLKRHHYASPPGLAAWAQPYIQGHWMFTAFKYARRETSTTHKTTQPETSLATKALRISFKTMRPFYPYREPLNTSGEASRSLFVHYFGPNPVRGELDLYSGKEFWNAEIKFSGRVSGVKEVLEDVVPLQSTPNEMVLTSFVDFAVQRKDGDIYFVPGIDTTMGRPPYEYSQHNDQTEGIPGPNSKSLFLRNSQSLQKHFWSP